jgi:dTDP-4-amino-4,6-dideoxygalactose transaminase
MIPLNDLGPQRLGIETEVGRAVDRVLNSGRYVLGQEGECFEREFADYCGASFAIACASGTDALELALRSLGVGARSRVATVANAGGYSSIAVQAVGATPVYIDVEATSHLMDLRGLAAAIGERAIDAIVVTHLYGRMHDMPEIMQLAGRLEIPVIEDCAQAHGACRGGRKAGTWGDAGCFSFYPTKNLGGMGDAGMVVTKRSAVAERMRSLRQYGWGSKYMVAVPGGRNSRMDELQAAVLRAKLPHLDSWNAARQSIASAYSGRIRNQKIETPASGGEDYVAHLYVVCCADRGAFRHHLAARGIASDVHYPLPDHKQEGLGEPAFASLLPVTEALCSRVVTLPCFPGLRDHEVDAVIAAVNAW